MVLEQTRSRTGGSGGVRVPNRTVLSANGFLNAGFYNGRLPERVVLQRTASRTGGSGDGRVPERAALAADGFQNGGFLRCAGSRTSGSGWIDPSTVIISARIIIVSSKTS